MNCQKAPRLPLRQSGAALIIAIMVVALVAVLAIGSSADHWVTLRRAGNQVLGEQAYGYLRGVENLASMFLQVDYDADANGTRMDNCADVWAQEAPPFVVEGGAYTGVLEDLQGRFNLNSLVPQAGGVPQPQPVPNNVHQARFYRLLQSFPEVPISPEEAQQITEAVIDWIDGDQNPTGFSGAEDDAYGGGQGRPAYRTADRAFTDVSELLLVAHMTPPLYRVLAPHLTVWPRGGGDININTATPNVLRALFVPAAGTGGAGGSLWAGEPLGEQLAEPLLEQQALGGFADVNAFKANAAFAGTEIVTDALSTYSDYFLLAAMVKLGDYNSVQYDVMSRVNGKVEVISRSQSAVPMSNWCLAGKARLKGATGGGSPSGAGGG